MNVTKIKLVALKRPERNVRMHTEKQLKEFERSISMFGQIRPIVVDDNLTILAGNGLYEALTRMGWDEADVLQVSGLTENQKKKLMLADTGIRTSELMAITNEDYNPESQSILSCLNRKRIIWERTKQKHSDLKCQHLNEKLMPQKFTMKIWLHGIRKYL